MPQTNGSFSVCIFHLNAFKRLFAVSIGSTWLLIPLHPGVMNSFRSNTESQFTVSCRVRIKRSLTQAESRHRPAIFYYGKKCRYWSKLIYLFLRIGVHPGTLSSGFTLILLKERGSCTLDIKKYCISIKI